MAQNLEPYHVPQQNRRNKLRTNQEQEEEEIITLNSCLQTNQQQQGLSLSLSCQLDSQRYNAVSVLGDFLKQNGGGGITTSVPLGPFTGYESILKTSRFLKPAQQVLDDLFGTVSCEIFDFSLDCLSSEVMRGNVGFSDRLEHQWKNSKLVLMLDEVYRRYKLYCQQMQSVVESFQSVAGLGNAAPYFCCAIKIVSKHFSCLKNALLDQIHFTSKTPDDGNEKIPRFWAGDEHGSIQHQNPTLNYSFLRHPVWRSQRGLPDHAVAVLKTWLFEHFLHPYPTDPEKQILAQQTGLSRTQVSNWFINARVRLWKPMVEEVYNLASQQAQVPVEVVNHSANMPSDFSMERLPQTSNQQKPENVQMKRPRNELADSHVQRREQRSASFDNLARHYHTGINASSGVSLALGLHQNNGIDLSRPLPISIAQHVNLEMISMMGSASATSFQAQNEHFDKD